MKTSKERTASLVDYLNTASVILILLAIVLAWRSFVGQDNGVVNLLSRLF